MIFKNIDGVNKTASFGAGLYFMYNPNCNETSVCILGRHYIKIWDLRQSLELAENFRQGVIFMLKIKSPLSEDSELDSKDLLRLLKKVKNGDKL